MKRPLLLDLFCGAGGAAQGYYEAGFDVVGVDIKPQPRYPFEFYRADALAFLRVEAWNVPDKYDAIHASPPCQAYSSATKAWGTEGDHADLYGATRDRLIETGLPWVIENVIGAPYDQGIFLCGSMFDLEVQRHRMFESSELLMMDRVCKHNGRSLTVTGHSPYWWAQGDRVMASTEDIERAMGIDWMNRREIVQAIPPAYTRFIGSQLLDALERVA